MHFLETVNKVIFKIKGFNETTNKYFTDMINKMNYLNNK